MNKKLIIKGYLQEKKLPINNSEILVKNEFFISPNNTLQDIYIYELDNVYVSPYGVVMKNWKVVKESLYSMFFKNNNFLTFLKKILLGKVKQVSGTSAIIHNAFFSNYYHWSAEALPRLFMIKDYASHINLLLHEESPKFIKEYANLLGFKSVIYIKANELVKAEKLILPMHSAEGLFHNGKLLLEMVKWLKTKVNTTIDKNTLYHEKLFLSRDRAAYRKIINNNEVLKLLSNYNFTVINLEDYSVIEQILLLSKAKYVIGIHGAGLVNIMFMEPKSLVLNLIHEGHYDPSFYNLASSLDIDFILLQCKAANIDSRGVAWDSFIVDILKLKYYLDNYSKS